MTVDGVAAGRVARHFIGANQRWPDDGKGIWDPGSDQPANRIDRLARETGLRTLRYPGGTVANLFDFTKAVGPLEGRGCQTSGGFANGRFMSTDSRFGPDENERFADAIGGETMVMVPMINRSADDAADYVEYMNSPADGRGSNPSGGVDWAEVRAQNGHPKPYGIHYWEVGNEPYLPGQHYWWANDPEVRVRQFIEGGWQRQTGQDDVYADNDGLFLGCDLANRRLGTGAPGQEYRVRFGPIALPGDELAVEGVGDGPITEPVLRVAGTVWQRTDSLAGHGPDAQVYVVDQEAGTVRFGDGVTGAVPPTGASLSIEYTSGPHQGYIAYREAMKEVDPSIEVCSGWGRSAFVEAMGARSYDCLGTHSYSTPAGDGTVTRHGNLQAAASTIDAELRELRQGMARYFPEPALRPDLLVTEYGTLDVPERLFEARLSHVLYLAALLIGQLENGVPVSINSNLTGLPRADGTSPPSNLFGTTPRFLMTGRAAMLRLYGGIVGDEVITTEIHGNPVLEAPAGGTYGALRVVATCAGRTTRVLVVNRDPGDSVTAQVRLPDQRATGVVALATLNGESIESYNDPDSRDQIDVSTSQAVPRAGVVKLQLERHSVTLLEIPGNGAACPAA